jgi:hypothetical protein
LNHKQSNLVRCDVNTSEVPPLEPLSVAVLIAKLISVVTPLYSASGSNGAARTLNSIWRRFAPSNTNLYHQKLIRSASEPAVSTVNVSAAGNLIAVLVSPV